MEDILTNLRHHIRLLNEQLVINQHRTDERWLHLQRIIRQSLRDIRSNVIAQIENLDENSFNVSGLTHEDIANLPSITINQAGIGEKTTCSVCLDDLFIDTEVKQLPCKVSK